MGVFFMVQISHIGLNVADVYTIMKFELMKIPG